jgi:broad specificity phosphatase PhoE
MMLFVCIIMNIVCTWYRKLLPGTKRHVRNQILPRPRAVNAPHMPPRLFFVRHGEAQHNPLLVRANFKSKDPAAIDLALCAEARSILNPTLTDAGRAQAAALGERMESEGLKFDLCVTTPLARAIETAHLAFGRCAAKFLVTADAVETAAPKLAGPQRGHSKEQMLTAHPFLAEWDLTHVREEGDDANWVLQPPVEPTEPGGGRCGAAYVNPVEVTERISPLAEFLKARPEERIVVVGHSGVFDKLLGINMGNCELVEHVL